MSAIMNEVQYATEPYYEQGKSLSDYAGILRRRISLILVVAVSLFILAIIVALVLPSMYRSTATILIQEQEIPQDLVRSTVTSYADERIQVISQTVMTRAVLLDLVDKYGLYGSKRNSMTNEEVLDRMRADIKLTPISAEVTDRRTGSQVKSTIAFTLSYDSESPGNAQKIANELTTLYLNENVKNRQQKAAETSSFLQEEADRVNKHISELEQKLSEFKAKNQGKLPELAALNMQSIDRTDSELQRIEQNITALEDRKILLEGQLVTMKPGNPILSSTGDRVIQDPEDRLKSLEAQLASSVGVYTDDHPDIKRMRREIASLRTETGTTDNSSDREAKLAQLEASLSLLKQKYSDDHPDVLRAQRAIAALKNPGSATAKAEPAAGEKKQRKPDNPAYVTLQTQIESANAEIRALRTSRNDLHSKLSLLEGRLEQAPEVERAYLELTRDMDNSRVRYREIREKQMQAEVAEQLEQGRKAERFTLIDPPQFPERPFKPNRPAIIMLGLVIASFGGLGGAAIREAIDRTVRSTKDTVRILRVPVLAIIPALQHPRQVHRRSGRLKWLLLGAVIIAILFALCVHFFYMPIEVIWYSLLRRLT